MLLQFNFKNYKSFKDDTTLDMTAAKISENNYHVKTIADERVLPVAAIYGANASGKTNVVAAFKYMTKYVLFSLDYGGETDKKKEKSRFNKPTPFLFASDSRTAESSFEVYFIDSAENKVTTYNYGFSVNSRGVCEEWLNYKTKSSRDDYKRIFYRKGSELDLSGISQKSQENIKVALEKETLLVSLGAKLKIAKLKRIRDWFCNCECANFGNPVQNLFLSQMVPVGFADDENVRKNVTDYLSSFDPSIVGFDVEVIKDDEDDDTKPVEINALHKMIDSDKTVSIPLEQESAGTLKMFALYPLLQDVLTTGGILCIDELDARLHPLLVRNFIITFLNPEQNPKNAQLIFTTHDSWQLDSKLLRRDEIWFTEKAENGVSTLYSLADFVDEDGSKIRKDENYEKNYLLGKYGAVPSMKNIDLFREE